MPADARAGSASRPLTVADRLRTENTGPQVGDVLAVHGTINTPAQWWTYKGFPDGSGVGRKPVLYRYRSQGTCRQNRLYASTDELAAQGYVYVRRVDSGPVTICECGDPDCIAGEGAFTP